VQRAARGGTEAISRSGSVVGKAASTGAKGTKKAASAVKENPMLAVAGAGIVGSVVGEIRNRSRAHSSAPRRPSTSRATSTKPKGKTPSKSTAKKASTRKATGATTRGTKGRSAARKGSAKRVSQRRLASSAR
jgi:hypothetical protein